MTNNELVQVSRRDLHFQLWLYVLFAGATAYVAAGVVTRFVTFPVFVALNFATVSLLLFPAFRVWKQSRGRETPRLLPMLRTLVPVTIATFAVAWLLQR